MDGKLASAISDSGVHTVSNGYLTFRVIIALSGWMLGPGLAHRSDDAVEQDAVGTRRRAARASKRRRVNSIPDLPRIGG
jgi:hypothetical protein